MIIKRLVFVALLLLEAPAFGMVYTWKDSTGIRHYVNKYYDIPERYLSRAKALYPEPSDSLSPPQALPVRETAAPVKPQQIAKSVVSSDTELPGVKTKRRKRTVLGINLKKGVARHPKGKSTYEEE